ncbi:iron-containing alcohol dehydrogenase [Neofamilia massiliensis]|uniref:iron-containing alcohol dehydrogenase n=1 Tax=Neofamilia massiliensis TaxID=1673724 RepID=UPI0006BB99A6|nr:iron-containing alcohol dehydrogenase [Neofamilia massiliensis]
MKDFTFEISTKILFGKDTLENLGKEILPYGKNVLLVYGQGSIKKTGLYDKIVNNLKNIGIKTFDLDGIVPNPRIDKVREGVVLAKENQIDFILAVGGGSVIDSAKLIALGAYSEADPWDIVIGKEEPNKAIQLGAVLTLSATGSEMDTASVISNEETGQKLGWGSELVRPRFAILNPELTYTVDAYHTAAGTADIMSHTMENYFSLNDGAFFQDRTAEGILKTCIKYGPIAIKDSNNYEARANLMWAGSWAINGLLDTGKDTAWSVHPMEHELSALRDITHGVGLAILTPYWLEYCLNDQTEEKIADFATNVFGIKESSKRETALKGIDALRKFFTSMGISERLREEGFTEEDLPLMAKNCVNNRSKAEITGFVHLEENDILEIYKKAF